LSADREDLLEISLTPHAAGKHRSISPIPPEAALHIDPGHPPMSILRAFLLFLM